MSLKNKRVLVTYGPTWVPIDDVRVISNRSTGQLGTLIAKGMKRVGALVTVLEGPVLTPLRSKAIRVVKYFFFDELHQLLTKELKKKYDLVIHAAAVADYKLKKSFKTKLPSEKRNIHLHLTPTVKIVDKIKKRSPRTFLVGFKLNPSCTKRELFKKAQELVANAKCDLVVANTLRKNYEGYIVDSHKNILAHSRSRKDLSARLIRILKEKL